MRRNMTKMLALLLAVALTAVCFTGCSNTPAAQTTEASKQTDAETKAPETDEPTTAESTTEEPTTAEPVDYKDIEFRIAWWGSDKRHNSTISLIEAFEKDYKNLATEVEYMAFGDFFKNLSTQATGNNLPDVFQMDYGKIVGYAESGLLLPLDEYIESGALDLSKVSAETLASGVIDGKTVGLVTGVNYTIASYSKKIADAAGVTLSDTPTLDEVIDAAKKVYDHCGAMIYPMEWKHFARLYGEERYTDDGKAIAFSKETLVKYMEFLADGVEYGYIYGAKDYDVLSDMATAQAQGRIWYSMSGFSNSWKDVDSAGNEWVMCAMPYLEENGPIGFAKPNMFWCISADCKNPDLAVAFLNYFVNNTATYDICATDRGLPINSEMATYVAQSATDTMKKVYDFVEILNDGNLAEIHAPEPSAESEVNKLITGMAEEIHYGTLARDQFEARAEQIIGQIKDLLAAAQ